MYSIEDLLTAVRSPNSLRHLSLREINKLYHSRLGYHEFNPGGIDIFEESWDNLIILDACRYDIFQEEHNLPGDLEYRISRGSMSKEFIIGNFKNKNLHDTVYISGNSWYARLCQDINTEVHYYSLIDSDYPEKTEMITNQAKSAVENYPKKRLIVHYMLPHAPYIGKTAKKNFPDIETQRNRLFADLRTNNVDISDNELKRAYRENLRIVMPKVAQLLNIFPGKTVVTADHGELLGDLISPIPYREYSHPKRLYVDELVKVPWLVYEEGVKEEIISEPPPEANLKGLTDEDIKKNLKNLGYLN